MLRLAFDFIITWRETRTRPNAYIKIPTKEGMTYDPKKTVAHDKRWVIE